MRKLVLSLAALTAIATSITLAAAPANAESMADPSGQAGEHSTERYVVVTDGSAAPLASLNAEAADDADTYPNVGATVTELTPVEAAELDARRGVTVARDTRVSLVPDPGFTPKEEKANGAPMTTLEPDVAAMGHANSWGLDRIDQRTLPLSGTYTPNPGVGGGGVDVYVIDTGLATQHPEFQGRVGNGYDVVDGDSIPQECGSVPHGTHVAGTIASTRFGVAPQSTIHGVRVLDCDGQAYVSDVIAGMNWVVSERSRIGRTVVANMSLGGGYNSALNAATANMERSGVVTVAAAGNEADNASYHSPGSTPEAITVAASTSNDSDASYSNYGSIIDLYAPGSDIWSTYAYDPSQSYRLSGTSMAAPHIAGWATLYLGLHPDATPAQVTSALLSSGTRGMINGEVGGTPDILPFVGDLAGAPSPPSTVVEFRQASLSVAENAGTVNLSVTRSGDTTVQSSVNYSRIAGSATAGTDFTLPAGTLTFQPGESTKTIPLTVSNDASTEAGETIVVSLHSPTAGTALTSTTSMTVNISASDQRPDGLISTSASTGYVGNNVYNTTGAGQARTVSARRTVTRTFYARVYNDGNVSNAIAIKGSAALAGSTVRYYSGSTNVTTAMRSASGWRVTLNRGAYKVVTVKITIPRTASVGSYKSATVTSNWTGDGTRSDAVKAIVKVIR